MVKTCGREGENRKKEGKGGKKEKKEKEQSETQDNQPAAWYSLPADRSDCRDGKYHDIFKNFKNILGLFCVRAYLSDRYIYIATELFDIWHIMTINLND